MAFADLAFCGTVLVASEMLPPIDPIKSASDRARINKLNFMPEPPVS
jgi:hypothetical protein